MSESPRHGQVRLVGTNVIARRKGVPERTVRHWAAKGLIRAYRIGKLWKFDVRDFPQRRAA